jgi:hypothetical protein
MSTDKVEVEEDYEPDYFDGGDSAFAGSIGDLQEINIADSNKSTPFFDWLDQKLKTL